jgi:hypothetical protein
VTVRTVIAVALAVGILGASLPAIESARVDHADARLDAEVSKLERIATSLARENAVVAACPARRQVTLSLPTRSWGTSGTETLDIPPDPGGRDVVWTPRGGSTTRRTFADVSLVAPPGFALETGGRHRLRLELDRASGVRVVVVTNAGRRWEP